MKKLFVILLASMTLVACGDGTSSSEANRDETENYDNTTPSVSPDMESDTTSSDYMQSDTTSTGTDMGTGTGTTGTTGTTGGTGTTTDDNASGTSGSPTR